MSAANPSLETLPVEALARIGSYLCEADLSAHFLATSRRFRFEVAPAVTHVPIGSTSQMTPDFGRRFQSLEAVSFAGHKFALFAERGFVSKLIPFLASFRSLKQVDFEGDASKVAISLALQVPDHEGGDFGPEQHDSRANPQEATIHLLCEAYRTGELPAAVPMKRLFCPWPPAASTIAAFVVMCSAPSQSRI